MCPLCRKKGAQVKPSVAVLETKRTGTADGDMEEDSPQARKKTRKEKAEMKKKVKEDGKATTKSEEDKGDSNNTKSPSTGTGKRKSHTDSEEKRGSSRETSPGGERRSRRLSNKA